MSTIIESQEPRYGKAWAERMQKALASISYRSTMPPEPVYRSLAERIQAMNDIVNQWPANVRAQLDRYKSKDPEPVVESTKPPLTLEQLNQLLKFNGLKEYEDPAKPTPLERPIQYRAEPGFNGRHFRAQVAPPPKNVSIRAIRHSNRSEPDTSESSGTGQVTSVNACVYNHCTQEPKTRKHVRFRTRSNRADHLNTPDQKSLTNIVKRAKKLDRIKNTYPDQREKDARIVEYGGIIHPPTVYKPTDIRKNPNKNGVRITANGQKAKRQCGLSMQERKFWLNETFEQALKRPAASLLPGRDYSTGHFRNGQIEYVRSEAEVDVLQFIRGQLLPDVTINDAESTCPRNTSDDIGLTFSGNLVRWTRDQDLDLGENRIQLAIKGTSFRSKLYWMLKPEDGSDKHSDLRYKPILYNAKRKAFTRFRKTMLNWFLRDGLNILCLDYVRPETETIRPLYYVSAKSAKKWNQKSAPLKDSGALLDLLETESEKFRDYYFAIIDAVFPDEAAIIARACRLFRAEHKPSDHPNWDSINVAIALDECLCQAKREANFDDTLAHTNWRFRWKLDFEDLELPRTFKPTNLPSVRPF